MHVDKFKLALFYFLYVELVNLCCRHGIETLQINKKIEIKVVNNNVVLI